MNSVSTVAFGFMSPEGMRAILRFRGGFTVCMASDAEHLAKLEVKNRERNVVILTNFAKRHDLAEVADRIGYLVVLANGKHEEIAAAKIPFLDAAMVDGEFRSDRTHTPTYFVKKIPTVAVSIELETPAASAPPKRVAAKGFESIDQWFGALRASTPRKKQFTVDIEQPTCLYVVGQLNRDAFKAALKAAVKRGMEHALIRQFYTWLSTKRADTYAQALQTYLFPKNSDKSPTSRDVAKHFDLPIVDIELIETIYATMEE